MVQKLLTLLAVWLFAAFSCLAQGESIGGLYQQLDQAIAESSKFIQQKEDRIQHIKQALDGKTPAKLALVYNQRLYEEYKSYNSDSAIFYLQKCIHLSQKMNLPAAAADYHALLAYQNSTSGAFAEALTLLNAIDKHSLDTKGKKDYYLAYHHVYGELGFSNLHVDNGLSLAYYHKQDAYRDTLFSILNHNSEDYLMRKETQLTSQKKLKEALKLNDIRLSHCKEGTHEYGIVAYYRYLIYRELKDEQQVKYWLIKSAISDVKNAINDQASLWILAGILSEEGDVERAYKYVNFSWNASKNFSTRIRSWQISPILGTIDCNYQQKLKQANQRLIFAIVVVSIMTLILALLALYVNKQRNLVTAARNELKKTNEKLEKLNLQLSATNQELKQTNDKLTRTNDKLYESNGVKEEYIGQFLGACSHYIDKLDKQRLKVNKMVKSHQYQELYDLTKSTEVKEQELDELYSNFDKVFLHLFPDFVDNLNSLLKDEYKIHLADPSKLSALVRVFALIRLGIDDSTKIAEFLHYAVNTIYNYRAKLRNGAIGDRNEFEKKVKELGVLDRKENNTTE